MEGERPREPIYEDREMSSSKRHSGVAMQPQSSYRRLPLGSITSKGWIHKQLRVEADGMSGHLDELEPEMIGNPFVTRSRKEGVTAAWCSEIAATYWTGLVQLAFTLDDPELKTKAEKWVNGVLARHKNQCRTLFEAGRSTEQGG